MPRAGAAGIRAAVLDGPKRGRPLPKVLTVDEVDRLIADRPCRALPRREHPARRDARGAARVACFVELLYATGLRVSELVALPAPAARRARAHSIIVRGKGNKERMVPLGEAGARRRCAPMSHRAEGGQAGTAGPLAVPRPTARAGI